MTKKAGKEIESEREGNTADKGNRKIEIMEKKMEIR